MKMKLHFSLLIFLACMEAHADSTYDPTADLNLAFAGRCSSIGKENEAAQSDAKSINDVIGSIAEDPFCNGLKTTLSQISNLSVTKMLAGPEAKVTLEELTASAGQLDLAIAQERKKGSEADNEYIDALKKEMISTRVEMAKLAEGQKTINKKSRLEGIQSLDKYTNTLILNLEQGEKCLTNRPETTAQVGAQVLGLTAHLGSGIAPSLILSASRLIDHLIRFVRNKNLSKDIKKIVDVGLGQALGCAFEGVARTYCEARDFQILATANKEAIQQTGAEPTWKKGLSVIAQDSPAYNEFATKIQAGSPKSSDGEVTNLQIPLRDRFLLDSATASKNKLLQTMDQDIKDAKNKEIKFKSIVDDFSKLIKPECMSSNMSGTCLKLGGPFGESFIEEPECGPLIFIYTRGGERKKRPELAGNSNMTCQQYVDKLNPLLKPPFTIADMASLRPTMTLIFNEASDSVSTALARVQQTSYVQLLASLDSEVGGRTAKDYLINADAYLASLLNDPNSIASKEHPRALIENTQKSLRTVIGLISQKATTDEEKAAEIVTKIGQQLNPRSDKAYIPNSISLIVQQDIDYKVSKGEMDETLANLMQLPNTGNIAGLLKAFGDLDPVFDKINNAKEQSEANITGLAGAFSENLKNRFEQLKKRKEQKIEGGDSQLTLLCMQSLAIPAAPKLEDLNLNDYCKGTVRRDQYDQPGNELKFDDLVKTNIPTRMCALHDFYRKSNLYKYKLKEKANSKPGSK